MCAPSRHLGLEKYFLVVSERAIARVLVYSILQHIYFANLDPEGLRFEALGSLMNTVPPQ